MATKNNNECSSQALGQGDNATCSSPDEINANQIKSGSLFLSSKGIGWTSWKKRWFILTRTSLVFYRSDPSVSPQKGGETNLTLGGIDLNSSASVEVKPDKKLITVFFPDGSEGRVFTLKAETMDELYEWKSALESALAQAPSAPHSMGQNGVFSNEQTGVANGPGDQQNDKSAVESMVIGKPILLVLEDIDGSSSFLEKALSFIENHGVKVEGILRQAADVELVHCRVREYEQGKTEFSPNEDAHVIADCIKYILRELPSSPVPASCCTALLQAYKSDRANRTKNMRNAILETFPEPNRKLLQRILIMCKKVASHKTENLMSISAVAACMSPLLLRPLLSGECELENTHMDVAGDGSLQLLQAAAAANHAQAIIITLLEEYNNIFGEGKFAPELFSNSEEFGSETEEASDEEYDDEEEYDDDEDEEEYEEEDEDYDLESGSDDHGTETDGEYEHSVAGTNSDDEETDDDRSDKHHLAKPHDDLVQSNAMKHKKETQVAEVDISGKEKSSSQVNNPKWGRSPAKKNHSLEPDDFSLEEEEEIERLIALKMELQKRVAQEADANAKLRAKLEKRKKALHKRRLALEKDVAKLRKQLQKERDIKAALEAEMSMTPLSGSASSKDKMKVDIEGIGVAEEKFNNLKQRVDGLGVEINHQIQQNRTLMQNRGVNMEKVTREASPRIERSSESEHQSQSNDPFKDGSSKTGWLLAGSSMEVTSAKNSFSPSKKSLKGEVAKLREQLQKERDIKAALEAELGMTPLSGSASSKDKMKADIERIDVAEEKFNNLKQGLDDLGVELNHQIQQNRTLMQNRGINMEKVTREASPHIERSSESEKQNQFNDPIKDGSSKTRWLSAGSSMEGTIAKKSLKGEVAKLREQLLKERDIKAALEAEMSMTPLSGSASSKDKMKVDIKRIGVAEEKFNNLKQRLNDLGVELNHQIQHFRTLMQNRVINMEKATREASPRLERSSESKHQSRSNDPIKDGSSKTGWLSAGSSMEVTGGKNFFSPSKKSTKGEGDNPTSSALTRLTTRLDFLKERRNQIASELQNIDKTQEPSRPISQNPNATAHNVEKSRGPEGNREHHTHHQPPNNQWNANRS